jgi:glucose/arabinose dehydrogenase
MKLSLNHIRSVAVVIVSVGWASPSRAQLDDPIPATIPKGNIVIDLQNVARGLTAPVYLTPAGDNSNRLFVVDQGGSVQILQNGTLLPEPFLDLKSRLVDLGFFGSKDENDFDERGLLGLAFHPDFGTSGATGFGKVYTYTSEPVAGAADFTVTTMPAGTAFNHQSVIAEWSVDPANPNRIAVDTRRELLRVDEPQFNHNAGMMSFGPDRQLYIGFGDGGQGNDNGDGHGLTGNGQDRSNVLGSLLRIDVDGTNSANGKYGVPSDNPFVGNAGMVDEIYAYGFRNPFRFSFDSATGALIVGDVGQGNIEEVDVVTAGGNYGWRLKEGSFAFNFETGDVSSDVSGLPGGLIDPVLEYDHSRPSGLPEGLSVIGGFVYRGDEIPELQGKYVFGDFSTQFRVADGRLFYGDLQTGQIWEFQLGTNDRPLGLFVKGLGQDADGELYLLASSNLGPFGSGGQVLKLSSPLPEPALGSLLGGMLFAAGLALRGRRSAMVG